MESIFFFLFKGIAIISAMLLINAVNPVHAVLLLILVFANIASILILLGAEYLALIYLVVYLGAILVLFLFVIMVLHIKLVETTTSEFNYGFINSFIIILLVSQFTYIMYSTFQDASIGNVIFNIELMNYLFSISNIQIIGLVLYNYYFISVIIVASILYIAMLGSIILTLEFTKESRRQLRFEQVIRKTNIKYII